ncbi:MAG: putative DNA binding domain-containing protein [Candidatus Eisenbacteria bacterium]|nr:putative DNA binding domain-containing protein [Candidatus Eisenbacteria bacterium]
MKDVVESLLAKGEGARTEFKSRVPRRDVLGQVLCSFANTGGGTMVIGVGDKGDVVGVPDAQSVTESLGRDAAQILSPPMSISATVVKVKGKDIVLVDVPEGADKPYTFGRKIYVRKAERSEQADVEALRDLLNSMPRFEVRWERRAAAGVQLTDLDMQEIDSVTASAQDLFGYPFQPNAATIAKLEALNLASHGQLHNGAVVLFAREPQRRFPQTRIRAIRFGDEEERQVLDNKVFEGHAFKLLQDAVQFIQSHTPVTADISGRDLRRDDQSGIPMVAVREALLNSVQHRDYEAYDGSIIIKISPTTISIWNPGGLPKGMTIGELKRVHYSRPRNPDIAHVFFLRGYVERVGSGTGRILTSLRSVGLPDAEWETVSEGLQINLKHGRSGGVNERQQALLDHLAEADAITVTEYLKRFGHGVTARQARIDLGDLVKKRYLVRRGSARSTRYERTAKKR